MDIDIAPDAGVLDGVRECDVAVIGSGVAGISTAYELCKRGKSVLVIDRGRICGGMTSRTSAHLAPLCDDLVSEMTKIRGKEATTLFCDSQAAAVDRIEEIQKKEMIDCDFRRLDGYLFQGHGTPADTIDEELEAVRAVGAPVHRLMGMPFNGCENRHVLRYPKQATFHPLKHLAGVAKACRENGVTFYRDSPVEEMTEENGIVTAKTARGAPGTSVSSTIRALSSLENQRRRPVSVITTSRRAVTSDLSVWSSIDTSRSLQRDRETRLSYAPREGGSGTTLTLMSASVLTMRRAAAWLLPSAAVTSFPQMPASARAILTSSEVKNAVLAPNSIDAATLAFSNAAKSLISAARSAVTLP
jgi:hypothetical protein